MSNLSFGIKYTPFPSRELGLCGLVDSIRARHTLPILVATNGRSLPECARRRGATHVPCGLGLSAGRNALARAAATKFLMILDDDVAFTDRTDVFRLLAHVAERRADVAAACYSGIRADSWALLFSNACAAGWFVQAAAAAGTVRLQTPTGPDALRNVSGVQKSHVVQNAFVARTLWLRAHRWDSRLQTAEDTLWFYQRYLQNDRVVFDPAVRLDHGGNKSTTADYNARSTRYREAQYLQWMCKLVPSVRRWVLPFLTLDCDQRTVQRRYPERMRFDTYWKRQLRNPIPLAWTEDDCERNPFALRGAQTRACR